MIKSIYTCLCICLAVCLLQFTYANEESTLDTRAVSEETLSAVKDKLSPELQSAIEQETSLGDVSVAEKTTEQPQGLSVRQKILMPGPLIEGHAKYEMQCEKCHSSFDKKQQTTLCLDCHTEIAEDRSTQLGFHGKMGAASVDSCQMCHKDHKGRDADIVGFHEGSFNHDATRFPLAGGHEALGCRSCHKDKEIKYRDTPSACVDCHSDDDVHKGATGEQCDTCHSDASWQKLKAFDHSTTDYPLNGAHKQVSCNSCHIAQQFTFKETACISCHLAADVHGGANGKQCDSCHSEKSWESVTFDHSETDFPLVGKHSDIPCLACHKAGEEAADAPKTCDGCHANQDVHLGRNGTQCENCHNSIKWAEILFDHNRDTDYLLTGKHEKVACTQCHIGAIDDPLPRDCASCHKADDVHHNSEMKVCGLCHSTQGWKSTSLFDHDFTIFPLIGMHRIVPCQSCHINNQFAAIKTDCKSCHQADDVHNDSLTGNCALCHTPNAWNPWQFDHSTQTEYPLDGKHKNLACDECHMPNTDPSTTSQVCGNCHQGQDIHNGEFGLQCGRCHSTNGFFELYIR